MKRFKLTGIIMLAALGLILLPVLAQAAAVLDFNIAPPTSGSISYAGGSAPLVGSGIQVDTVTGLGTPSNDGVTISFADFGFNALLFFETGASTGTWTWGANPTSAIFLNLYDAGNNLAESLIVGQFGSATVVYGGSSFYVSIASFYDTKSEGMLDFYGLPHSDYAGNFNISFNALFTGQGDAFESSQVLSGDVVNQPVPEPGTMMLLGSGLVGLAGWGRKKFRR